MTRLLILPLALAFAYGADVTGTWVGTASFQNEQGEKKSIPVTLQLKHVDQMKLEGTAHAEGEEAPLPISAGKVEGSQVYFEVLTNDDDGPVKIRVSMEISGDKLAGTFTREAGGSKNTGAVSFAKKI